MKTTERITKLEKQIAEFSQKSWANEMMIESQKLIASMTDFVKECQELKRESKPEPGFKSGGVTTVLEGPIFRKNKRIFDSTELNEAKDELERKVKDAISEFTDTVGQCEVEIWPEYNYYNTGRLKDKLLSMTVNAKIVKQ